MKDIDYEMIICIVNAGFSGEIMDIARREGATGGTIVHARGTANPKAEKEFQIAINPEKDLVMLTVKTDIKDNILKAIYNEAGLGTDANGVAFSLPVTNVVGIK
jgi:nitrogen regulatory protein PII